MNMADEPEGSAPSGRRRTAKPKLVTAKAATEKSRRKSEPPTVTDDLTGKFLRVGNKLYRTSDDKTPIVRIAGDRLKTSNIDALPDIIRIAKANGWTSIRVGGGERPLIALLQCPFDHLPDHRAASATPDRHPVERSERIGVEPDAEHRRVRKVICRHQTCPCKTRAMYDNTHR